MGNASKQYAHLRSFGRTYPQGVSLVTPGRGSLRHLEVQNRDNKVMYFWFGPIPIDVADPFGPSYPQDLTTWTAQQHLDVETLIGTYGMAVAPGEFKVMQTAHTGAVYSYIGVGTAVAHVVAAI